MFEEIASIYFFVTKSVKTDRIQVHLPDVDILSVHFRSCLAFLVSQKNQFFYSIQEFSLLFVH